MAVRDDFTAGEVLAAADLNDTFASKVPYAYGTATPSTTVDGFVWFDENSTPPAPKFWDGAAFQGIGGGKVLQVVRATDTTNRTTTSTSYVDASLSVTITPQKATSVVLLIASQNYELTFSTGTDQFGHARITDSSNNPISGAESTQFGIFSITTVGSGKFGNQLTLLGYATPASTSAQSYKVRYRVSTGTTTANIRNSSTTGQMYALEISA